MRSWKRPKLRTLNTEIYFICVPKLRLEKQGKKLSRALKRRHVGEVNWLLVIFRFSLATSVSRRYRKTIRSDSHSLDTFPSSLRLTLSLLLDLETNAMSPS